MFKRPPPALYFTFVAALGGFIFGFDASVIAGAIGFITQTFSLSPWQQGLLVSIPTLGGLIATLFTGVVIDRFGRRDTLLFVAILYLISALMSALADSYHTLLVARFIGGMAFCSLMITPIYIAEIASEVHRGKMISLNQLNIVLGFSASYFSNYYLLQQSQSATSYLQGLLAHGEIWRWMLALEIVPAFCWFMLLFSIPKSPRWLLLTNQTHAARNVMSKLYGAELVEQQLQLVMNSISNEYRSIKLGIAQLFSTRFRKAILLGLVLGIAQQITGINVVFFYAPMIFEQSGVGTNGAYAQAVWIGVVNVLFTLLAIATIDKFGRKPLLLCGLLGMALSLALCAYGFSNASYEISPVVAAKLASTLPDDVMLLVQTLLQQTFNSDVAFHQVLQQTLSEQTYNRWQAVIVSSAIKVDPSWILIGITGFVASFAMSLGPVMWVVFTEIFPTRVRAMAIALLSVVNASVSFFVQLVFPWELSMLGASQTFWLYTGFAVIAFVILLRYLPETKGKSLELEI